MKAIASIRDETNQLALSGELNFETIVSLWQQSLPLLAKYPHIKIDLSEITVSNSAGLALLIEWQKYAKRENKQITFSNIPSQLQSIAAVAGVSLSYP